MCVCVISNTVVASVVFAFTRRLLLQLLEERPRGQPTAIDPSCRGAESERLGSKQAKKPSAKDLAWPERTMVILHARSVLLLFTVPLMSAVEGYPGRRDVLPNAYSSEYGQQFYDNVGHVGGFRYSVRDAGNVWTLALCQADDDSDGQSNGLEMGDPCCMPGRGHSERDSGH